MPTRQDALQAGHVADRTDSRAPNPGGPAISVIIPAFNEQKHISSVLSALRQQTLPSQNLEVLLVDNGSTDETVAEASRFLTQLPLRILNRPKASISAVRNFGAAAARGRVFAFLDADCIPPPTWLADALQLAPEAGVWGAHYLLPQNPTWVAKLWFDHQARPHEGAVNFLPGGDLITTRETFDRLGGFSEAHETSEDVDLCQRTRQLGLPVVAHNRLAVHHEGTPRTLARFYRQNRWHGIAVLKAFVRKLPSTENLPLVALSVYTLLMFWAVVLTALFAPLSHHPWLPLLFLLLLCLPAALLSLAKAARASRWADAPRIFVLYGTYLLARAASITKLSRRNHR